MSAAPPAGDEYGVVVHDGRRYEVRLDRDPVHGPLERLGLGFLPDLAALVAVPAGAWLLLLGRGDYARATDGTATDPPGRDRGGDRDRGPRDESSPTSTRTWAGAGVGTGRVRSHAATAVVALGVLALLAGVAVPADVAPAYRYEAEPVGDAEVAAGSPAVLDCASNFRPRGCALERLVRRSDGLVGADGRAWSRYEYVRFADGFHRAATLEAEAEAEPGAELALRRVWTGGALRNATVDLRALPLPAGRAVLADEPVESAAEADEWAHTADEAADAGDERDARLVTVGEAHYRVVRTPARAPFRNEPVRWLGKGLLLGTGFALVWAGGGWRVDPPN